MLYIPVFHDLRIFNRNAIKVKNKVWGKSNLKIKLENISKRKLLLKEERNIQHSVICSVSKYVFATNDNHASFSGWNPELHETNNDLAQKCLL